MAELVDIAERVLGWARDNEQVEIYAVHDRETEVRAYGGEVESFSSAESQGIGVRVIVGGRQGFAWAGTLDIDVLAETLADARDNAQFGTVDEHAGIAEPDGVVPAELDLFDASLLDFAMGHPGTCGKDGQGVPVGDGTPTLRVTAMTIGGTAA